jgi:hypothetical protein
MMPRILKFGKRAILKGLRTKMRYNFSQLRGKEEVTMDAERR